MRHVCGAVLCSAWDATVVNFHALYIAVLGQVIESGPIGITH